MKFNLSEWCALIRVSEFWQQQLEGVCVRALHDQLSYSQMNNCADLHNDEGHRTGCHSDNENLQKLNGSSKSLK